MCSSLLHIRLDVRGFLLSSICELLSVPPRVDKIPQCCSVVTTLQQGGNLGFGDTVRERRKQLRLGLREFAQRAGMDPGNLSKIERGRLGAPQSEEALDRICEALEWRPGSDEADALKDQAAIENGQIPAAVLGDEVVMAKMPLLLRTLRNRQLEPEQLDRLIDLIREA